MASDNRRVNSKEAVATVIITVDNDEAPFFVTDTIVNQQQETVEAGDLIKIVSARDNDLNVSLMTRQIWNTQFSYNNFTVIASYN